MSNATSNYFTNDTEYSIVLDMAGNSSSMISDETVNELGFLPPGPPSFSEYQRRWLAYGPKVPALLSILGSMWLLYDLLSRHKNKDIINNSWKNRSLRSTYQRILFLMSSVDILSSVWYFVGTWAVTEENVVNDGLPPILFGSDKGNQATCSVQGFFLQVGLAAPLYNVSQAIYSLLIVRYGWREEDIQRRNSNGYFWSSISFWLLGFPLAFSFSTAIVGLPLKLYNFNPATFQCWYSPYPVHCDPLFGAEAPPGDCIRGTHANKFRFAFGFVPLWLALVIIVVAMALIAEKVYNLERTTKRSLTRQQQQQPRDRITATTSKGALSHVSEEDEYSLSSSSTDELGHTNNNENKEDSADFSSGFDQVPSPLSPAAATDSRTASSQPFAENTKVETSFCINNSITNQHHSSKSRHKDEIKGPGLDRTWKVVVQAMYFVGAFLVSWTCSMIYQAVLMGAFFDQYHGLANNFPFILVSAMLLPLQGFFNALVVLRPRYARHREENPEWNRWSALREALFEGGGVRGSLDASKKPVVKDATAAEERGHNNFLSKWIAPEKTAAAPPTKQQSRQVGWSFASANLDEFVDIKKSPTSKKIKNKKTQENVIKPWSFASANLESMVDRS